MVAQVAPKTWYVYTYAYPNGTLFYVGKGTSNRINSHEKEAQRECTCKKCQIIRQIWGEGKPVQKRIVFETLSEVEAFAYEKQQIYQNAKTLVNISGMPFAHRKRTVFEKSEEYMSAEEAASILGVSRRTVERYAEIGKLKRYKRGFRVLYKRSDVERLNAIEEADDQGSKE